ncbi:MAG: metallophosphoesterase [Pseudomonadota bacterium]
MPHPARRALRTLPLGVAAGLLLWLLLAQANGLWLPAALQPIGHAAFKVAFWLTAWAQISVMPATPAVLHRVPTSNAVLAAALTGLAAWALLQVALRWRRPPDPERRRTLGRIALWTAGAAGAGLASWGMWLEPAMLRVRQYTVPIRGLPTWAEGLRLVHISDTHLGPYVSLPYLRRAMARANALQADIAVLTGDYVHRTPKSIGPGIGVLGDLRAPLGVFAVLGNHDHWEGPEACRAALRREDIRLLDHGHVFLGPEGPREEPGEDALCLAGFGDLWEDEHDPAEALQGVPATIPRIVLSHHPDYAEKIPADLRVDFMLAGHTHGGQVYLPGLGTPVVPSAYGQKYAGGLCQGPRCPVLVSRGVGMAYLPVRLGVPPEIVVVTLVRA